jgi:hypothetical protein
MGFSVLRVINDDRVAPAGGFEQHGHRDMEIISYVLNGALVHKDSMGNGSVIRAGDVQRMSAGTGVTHSEFNESETDPVRFLQIWISPDRKNREPDYEQKHFESTERQGRFRLLVSPHGEDDSLSIHQDINLYGALLDGDGRVTYEPRRNRAVWVQMAEGRLRLNGTTLREGDGVAINGSEPLVFADAEQADILLFDLPIV